jgi:hypothetical protein
MSSKTTIDKELIITIDDGSFHDVKEPLEDLMLNSFGEVAQATIDGVAFIFDELYQQGDGEDVKRINNGIEARQKLYTQDSPKLFAFIKRHLSTESMNRVKRLPGWTTCREDTDPIALWKLVRISHTHEQASMGAEKSKRIRDWQQIEQKSDETVEQYVSRFEKGLLRVRMLDPNILSEEMIVLRFVEGINKQRNVLALSRVWTQNPSVTSTLDTVRNYFIREDADSKTYMSGVKLKGVIGLTKHARTAVETTTEVGESERKKHGNTVGTRKKKHCGVCERLGKPAWICATHDTEGHDESRIRKPTISGNTSDDGGREKASSSKMNLIRQVFMNRIRLADEDSIPVVSKGVVVFDNGSEEMVYSDNILEWLSEIETVNPILLKTVSGYVTVNQRRTLPFFGAGYYLPQTDSIISQSVLREMGIEFTYDWISDEYTIAKKWKTRKLGRLYVIDLKSSDFENLPPSTRPSDQSSVNLTQNNKIKLTWAELHKRLNHCPIRKIEEAVEKGNFDQLQILSPEKKLETSNCAGCMMGKDSSLRRSHPTIPYIGEIGEDLHIDVVHVVGSLFLQSVSAYPGLLNAVAIQTESADNCFNAIMSIVKHYEHYGYQVKQVHGDRAGVFVNVVHALGLQRIKMVQVAAEIHEKRAERSVRTVRNDMRAVRFGLRYRLPRVFVEYLYIHCIHIRNKMPNKHTNKFTPEQIVTGKPDSGLHLRAAFGDFGYFKKPRVADKMDSIAETGIFLGYETQSRACHVYLIESRQVAIRDQFTVAEIPQEIILILNRIADSYPWEQEIYGDLELTSLVTFGPNLNIQELNSQLQSENGDLMRRSSSKPLRSVLKKRSHKSIQDSQPELVVQSSINSNQETQSESDKIDNSKLDPSLIHLNNVERHQNIEGSNSDPQFQNLDDSKRLQKPRSNSYVRSLDDSNTSQQIDQLEQSPLPTRSGRKRQLPQRYINLLETSDQCKGIESADEYQSLVIDAELKEITQLLEYDVFDPVHIHALTANERRTIIPSKLFTVEKYSPTGAFIKFKSRWVVGGHKEVYMQDTSSPTIRTETMNLVLNVVVSKSMKICTADVTAAFLEAPITGHRVHVRLDKGTTELICSADSKFKPYVSKDQLVVELKRAVYGLKEAAIRWYETIHHILCEIGYKKSQYDACLYTKHDSIIIIHVDDMLICAASDHVQRDVTTSLQKHLRRITVTKETNGIVEYLGLVLTRVPGDRSIIVTQPAFVKQLMESFNLEKNKLEDICEIPYTGSLFETERTREESPPLSDVTQYRSDVMKFQFLTKSRPDIKLVIAYLTTKMEHPSENDRKKLIRLAKYINGTRLLGVKIAPSSMQIYCSADAAHAVHNDLKGHTGVTLSVGKGNGLVYSQSKKQSLTAQSSTEAELIALNTAARECVVARGIMAELGAPQGPVAVEQDNKSTIIIAERGAGRGGRSKSISIRCYWVSEQIAAGEVKLVYVPSKLLIADGLTKPIDKYRFLEWRNSIMNMGAGIDQ